MEKPLGSSISNVKKTDNLLNSSSLPHLPPLLTSLMDNQLIFQIQQVTHIKKLGDLSVVVALKNRVHLKLQLNVCKWLIEEKNNEDIY